MIPQVRGFQGCYLDNHRNNWRCARAVRKRPLKGTCRPRLPQPPGPHPSPGRPGGGGGGDPAVAPPPRTGRQGSVVARQVRRLARGGPPAPGPPAPQQRWEGGAVTLRMAHVVPAMGTGPVTEVPSPPPPLNPPPRVPLRTVQVLRQPPVVGLPRVPCCSP